MARLGEAHIAQILAMKAEGKKVKDIAEFISKTYNIECSIFMVYAAIKNAKKTSHPKESAVPKPHKKRAYHKRGPQDIDEASIGRMLEDIQGLLKEIPEAYKGIIKHIRADLIKSRNEVYQMRSGAGMELPESKIR